MKKTIVNYIAIILIFGIVLLGLGFLTALIISNKFSVSLKDVTFIIGMLFTITGIMSAMQGNPSGINISNPGHPNSQYDTYVNLQVTKNEREKTGYIKGITVHSMIKMGLSSITLILGGFLMVVIGVLL